MKNTINVTANVIGIKEATEKVEKYLKLLKEAEALANELAAIEFSVVINNVKENEK